MKFLSLLLVFCFSFIIFNISRAQSGQEPCSSAQIHERLMQTNTAYRHAVESFENQELVHNAYRTPQVYTIPVVVHVIHEGEPIGQGSNISDAQVQSAIVGLNEDFRKMAGTNGDGDGVDIEIEFCLASRDPDGNSTTGINRVDGSVIPNYAEQGIESTGGVGAVEEDVKALSVWPREDYVNIWVVNEIEDNDAAGGVQGYAYFPIDNIVDGIVVLHKAFGTVGNLKPNTDRNRVITHEMGHYFSLYHTFQATTNCGSETNCETQGDRICDTPPTILNASCSSPACGATQQVENYMDYTPEDCRDMFTQGQKDRMRDCLLTNRPTLLNSLGCVPPSNYDVGISAIVSPVGSTCDTNVEPKVILTNYGSEILTSATITYGVDGVMNQTYSWTGTLNPGMTEEVTLPSFPVVVGSHILMAESSFPNGQADEFSANDSNASDFSISPGIPLQLDVTLDYYGHETTWQIVDSLGEVVANGGPYPDMELGNTYQEFICAPTGCYDLIFYDAFGDGMGFVNGHYELYDSNDSLLVEGGGNFGTSETNSFCYVQEIPPGEAPIANFNVSSALVCSGEAIDFSDQSIHTPTTWNWSFEGGSPSTSTAPNPSNIVFSTPGDYTVTLTVTNAFGTSTSVTNISVEANPLLTLTATDVTCFDGNDGTVTSVATGNALTYLWSTGSNANNLTDVNQGNYTLVVTTSAGCTASSTVTVGAPDELQVTLEGQDLSCNDSNSGQVITTVTGGIGSYFYLWNTDATSEDLINVSAGYYAVTVTDDNGCQVTEGTTLIQSSGIDINLQKTNIDCSNGLGTATVNPSGGNGNFNILWSTGATSTSISNLDAGSYSVTVSDSGGCSITQEFEITQTSAPNVTVDTNDITCFGLNNGQANINATGGDGNYTYLWNNGLNQSFYNNLSAGTYSVTVEDGNGCQGSVSFEITEPDQLQVNLTGQNPSCTSDSDGQITSVASGGTGSLSYHWNTSETTSSLNNVVAGFYSLTVTDENGCTATAGTTLTQTQGISTNLMTFDIACNDEFGSATVTPTGGSGNYQISWSNGTSGTSVSQLTLGDYSVTVSDLTGCTITDNFSIEQNDSLSVYLDVENISCFGMNDGQLETMVQGGEGNYSYTWNTGASTESLTNLSAGTYYVEVIDEASCSGSASYVMIEPEVLTLSIEGHNVTCYNREDGEAILEVSGGTGEYTYTWTNGQTNATAMGLGEGSIGVTVTDETGCLVEGAVYISEPLPITIVAEELNEETCEGNNGSAMATAQGGTGTLEYTWSNGATGIFLDNVTTGDYEIEVVDENLCSETSSVFVGYNCDDISNDESTKLIEPDCGRSELMIEDFLTCIEIDQAEMYQWKFMNSDAGLFYEGYTLGNNKTFQLQNVEGVHYNLSMDVCVRFQKNGSWSQYGEVCTVFMKNANPVPVMLDTYCFKEQHLYNDILEVNPIMGASEYQWVFTSENPVDSITVISFVNQLEIVPTLGLMEDVEYQVVERVKIGGIWSDFGSSCSFIIKSFIPIEQVVIEDNMFNIYPNPSDGENLFLDLGNLFGSEYVIDIKLYDATGKIIEEFEILPQEEATRIVTHNFTHTLSSGVYFIQYTHDGDTNEKKLIVQ